MTRRVKSRGTVLVDPAKALEKLRQHQLAESGLYVLELVRVAVLSKATEIRLTNDSDDFVLDFDGDPLRVDDLTTLFDYYATRLPPPHRMGLLSYTQDRTISQYFGLTGTQFQDLLGMLTRSAFDPRPNFRYFNWDAWTRDLGFDYTAAPAPAGGVFVFRNL